ncbi:Hypothetical predicted protein, partial [Paramuricea clavata]
QQGNNVTKAQHAVGEGPLFIIRLLIQVRYLLEDKKFFQNILKSKSYQDSVKAIVIDEAHLG